MGMTKYLGPALQIGIGIALAPETGGMSLASMAMITGGAISAIGISRGSQDLQTAGTLIAGAGGIAAATGNGLDPMWGASPDATVAAVPAPTATPLATAQATDPSLALAGKTPPADPALALSGQTVNTPAAANGLQVSGGGPNVPGINGGASSIYNTPQYNAAYGGVGANPSSDLIALQKYSLISGALQGVGAAVGARTNADIIAQSQANQLAYQQSLSNRANSVGISPSLTPQPIVGQPTGLLSMNPATPPNIPHPV